MGEGDAFVGEVAGVAGEQRNRFQDDILLEAKDVAKHFPVTRGLILQKKVGYLKAVDGIGQRAIVHKTNLILMCIDHKMRYRSVPV